MKSFTRRHNTAVIIHLFYADLWPEILRYVRNIPDGFDLYVTVPGVLGTDIEQTILSDVPDASILRLQNRGRDIAPFLQTLSRIMPLGYRQICKIHSKKSLHGFGGHKWRTQLYEELLGTEDEVEKILSAFAGNPRVGIIGPASNLYDHQSCNALNRIWVERLIQKLGVRAEEAKFNFFAGSMFWFRPDAFRNLLALELTSEDFEPEAGQVDGTLAHAVERIFLLSAALGGYCSATTIDLAKNRMAAFEYANPLIFPPGKQCHKTRFLRGILARKAVAQIRYWIAKCRA